MPNKDILHLKKDPLINYLAKSRQAKFLFTIFLHIVIISAHIKTPILLTNGTKKARSDALRGHFKRRTRQTHPLPVIYFIRNKMRHFVSSFVDLCSKKAQNVVKWGENRSLAGVFEPLSSVLHAKLC